MTDSRPPHLVLRVPGDAKLAALLSEIGRQDFAAPVQEALARWGKGHAKADDLPELADRLTRVVKRLAHATDEEGSLEMAWAGESSGQKQVVHLSMVDLQMIDRWDRLAELLASGKVIAARLVPGVPEEEPTQLQILLDSEAEDAVPQLMAMSPTPAPVWRSSSKKRNKQGKAKQRSRS